MKRKPFQWMPVRLRAIVLLPVMVLMLWVPAAVALCSVASFVREEVRDEYSSYFRLIRTAWRALITGKLQRMHRNRA